MQAFTGDWFYSLDYDEPGQVIAVDVVWGEETAQVWLARRDAVVRVTVLYGDSRSLSYGPITSFDVPVGARQFIQLTDLSSRLPATARGEDLRNVALRFTVVSGEGAVVAYASSVDNGSGDSIFRTE